jgi:MFS family permease
MSGLVLLQTHPVYRAFWCARVLSMLGDTMAATALVLAVAEGPNASLAVGLLLLAQTLPRVFGPLVGTVVDRVDQRRLMIGCDLGQALLYGLLALLSPPLPVLLLLVLLATSLATLFAPAGRSVTPRLVRPGELGAANALLGAGLNTGVALGPAAGGLLFAALGLPGVLALNTLSFCASALLLRQLPTVPVPPPDESSRSGVATTFWAMTREGLVFVLRHRTARAVAIGLWLVVLFAGMDNVALVFLAAQLLDADALGYGLLASAYGVGMILGPLLLLRWSGARPTTHLLIGIALLAVGALGTGVAPVFAVALAAQAIAGLGNGIENVANDTLIQRTVPSTLLGRSFSTIYSGASAAAALAALLGGALLQFVTPAMVFLIAGAGLLVTLGIMWRLVHRRGSELP